MKIKKNNGLYNKLNMNNHYEDTLYKRVFFKGVTYEKKRTN